jgi:hypothetical protein
VQSNLRFVRPLIAALTLVAVAPRARAQIGSPNTFTADPPVPRPATQPCTVALFSNIAFADYTPKAFAWTPPTSCPGPWAKVVLNADFSVTAGRQFDRTANIWIGGANLYFGTTSEPSRSFGRSWHVERDLTDYSALLASPQPGEVDLGNTVNTTYTGVLFGTATVQLYPADHKTPAPRTADVVLPLSDRPTGGPVNLPTPTSTLARTFTLPTNIERAFIDVIAQSQGGDEFWYTCAPDDVAQTVQSCGGGTFRETEIAIDGKPAGVAPIYPWIYTGGIDPYLWGPIPGVQTLGFTPYRVDLTPFAGVLGDGRAHEVALTVAGAHDYFATTASLLLYLDRDATTVSGAVTTNTLAAPSPTVQENLTTATDGSVNGTVRTSAQRTFVIAGYVDTSHGRVRTELVQHIDFANLQTYAISTTQYVQNLEQKTIIATETHTQERGRTRDLLRSFVWPLTVDFSFVTNSDGSTAQKTSVAQRWDADELSTRGGLPVGFGVLANTVTTSDTLTFDATGKFLGPKDQSSSQSYFAVDGTSCYSRAIASAAGLLTQVTDGTDCPR